jgi:preprotein translocase subunit SecA
MLTKAKLPHQVLNAKQHAREAEIIAQAGRPKMITIATNMAGRGTDIVLGGNVEKQAGFIQLDEALTEEQKQAKISQLEDEWQGLHQQVVDAGGLHIIGTERHESRRIDNQLRGRSGRQGDPGSSRFYLSLDDDLLRIFAGDRLRSIMDRLKMPEGEPIEANMVSRAIESAQRKVEGRNFDIRKQLLEYDDVANDQRRETYHLRNQVLEASDVSTLTENLRKDVFGEIVDQYADEQALPEQWDLVGLERELENEWSVPVSLVQRVADQDQVEVTDLQEWVQDAVQQEYSKKIAQADSTSFNAFERSVFLYSLDTHWREHLAALDYLRQGIHLRGYAQKDPKQEYRREAFELYSNLLDDIKKDITRTTMNVRIASAEQLNQATDAIQEDLENLGDVQYQHADATVNQDASETEDEGAQKSKPIVNAMPKVGRNDACPCGSGKKYKHCHGALA